MADDASNPVAERLVASIQDLPTLPDVVVRITSLVANPRTSAADINETLSRDPSLSAKVLKLVNSPYYGFPRRITSITYAVVILGFSAIRNLAMSVFVFDAFKGRPSKGLDLVALWKHSVAVAIASSALAKRACPKHEEDAFMAGLLHDLGKSIMAQYRKDDLAPVVERVAADDGLFIEAERGVGLPYDHAELGGALMERWNLPEAVVAAVRWHHTPNAPVDEHGKRLAQLVHVGDALARLYGVGSGGDNQLPTVDPEAWAAMALPESEQAGFLRALGPAVDKAESFFAAL